MPEPAIAAFARRLHETAGGSHHVASPLGAWLLVALCAPACTGQARSDVTEALGMEPERAAAFAAQLLGSPHRAVHSASAAWSLDGTDRLAGWLAGLPATVEKGRLPDQGALDAWAHRHTDGLIERFPVRVTPDTLLVLATALATKVTWREPFTTASATELGTDAPFASRVGEVLRSPRGEYHHSSIVDTEEAGRVGVHTAQAADDLLVTAVVADAGVPPTDVLAAAYTLASAAVTGASVKRVSLFDLPLGDTPLWSMKELSVSHGPARQEVCAALLPAWSARSEHDLTDRADLGFPAAAEGLADLLGLREFGYVVKQAAMARYGRLGFEAAAVTAMGVRMAALMPPRERVLRTAELHFGHPYAAVAVAVDGSGGPWHGVPVFSAWVADVEEP